MIWQRLAREDARLQRGQLHAVRYAAAAIMSTEGVKAFQKYDQALLRAEEGRNPEEADPGQNRREHVAGLKRLGAKTK